MTLRTNNVAIATRERERESNSLNCHANVSAFASNSRGLLKKLRLRLVLPRVASNARNDSTNAFTCNDNVSSSLRASTIFPRHCETYEVSRGNLISSVIASEQSERGNLIRIASDLKNTQLAKTRDCHADFTNPLAMTDKTRDCHDSSLFAKSLESRNDEKSFSCRPEGKRSISKTYSCHIERSEISQNADNRDISVASLPQYDNVTLSLRDLPKASRGKTRRSRSFFSNLKGIANDGQNTQLATTRDCHDFASQNLAMTAQKHSTKPKRVSLSLATSALLAAVSLDIVAAAVNCRNTVNDYTPGNIYADFDGRKKVYTCTGNATNAELSTRGNHLYDPTESNVYWDTTIQFGTQNERLTIGGGADQILIEFNRTRGTGSFYNPHDYKKGYYKTLEFGLLSAGNKNFVIDAQGNTWIKVLTTAQANIGTITLKNNETRIVGGSQKNWDGTQRGRFQSVDIGHNSIIDTISNEATKVDNINITNATVRLISNTNSGNLSNLNISSAASVTTISNAGNLSNLNLNGAKISSLNNTGGTLSNLNINNGASISSINVSGGTINNLRIQGAGSIVNSISGGTNGTINNLYLGSSDNSTPLLSPIIDTKVNNLHITSFGITVDKGESWNQQTWTQDTATDSQRIWLAGGNANVAKGSSILINLGDNVSRDTIYLAKNLIISGTATTAKLGEHNVKSGRGTEIIWTTQKQSDGSEDVGFRLRANGSQAYITDVYRSLALSYMRRNNMTQNILDTMTTKTFHSDNYYNQEVELRLLQYDMARLTNKSVKFSKTRRKNQGKVDKVREKIARLTLTQSKGQDLEKGYNNFELIDQLDAIFIPYTGRRDWRFFALPYGTNSYVDLGANSALEWAGGAIFGIQKNLRSAGIFGGYVGYEYINTTTEFIGSAPTVVKTNSLQAGANYYKAFAIANKVAEGFIKASIRGGVDLPQFNLNAGGRINTIETDPTKTKVKIPLMWSVGAELKGGFTFYQWGRNSYITPEVGLSYDMLSSVPTRLIKPKIQTNSTPLLPIGADEFYGAILWHLPQIQASVRYYKIWGNTFRTNTKIGVRYNVLNNPKLGSFVYGNTPDETQRSITLPLVYGNVAFDFIWMIKKNHELSAGYDGLFYASTFKKDKLNDWFNGVTTTVNLKYAYWFGGSDYVTDKDGNAISRSIVDGKKKPKKSTKPKKKKTKKKKSKVVYIDG